MWEPLTFLMSVLELLFRFMVFLAYVAYKQVPLAVTHIHPKLQYFTNLTGLIVSSKAFTYQWNLSLCLKLNICLWRDPKQILRGCVIHSCWYYGAKCVRCWIIYPLWWNLCRHVQYTKLISRSLHMRFSLNTLNIMTELNSLKTHRMVIKCTDSSLARRMMFPAVKCLNWTKPNVLVILVSYLVHDKLTAFSHAVCPKAVMLGFTSKISC